MCILFNSKKGMSELYWKVGMIFVIVLVMIAWLTFVIRAGSGTEIMQEYVTRNLAYLSTTLLAAPGTVVYHFDSNQEFDILAEYTEFEIEVASKIKELEKVSEYPRPSKYFHPFPENYKLETGKFENNFFISKSGDKVIISSDPLDNLECDRYKQTPNLKTIDSMKLLLLTSSPETLQKLKTLSSSIIIKTETRLLDDLKYASINDQKEKQIDRFYDIILIVEENELDEQILLSNPKLISKKLGCLMQDELDVEIIQSKINIDTKFTSSIFGKLSVKTLNPDKLIIAINRYIS